jgi:hypothetical protein
MKKFVEQHPLAFGWSLLFIQLFTGGAPWLYHYLTDNWTTLNGAIQFAWLAIRDYYSIVYITTEALIAIVIITSLGWWREVGFVRINKWQDLKIYIVPIIITFMILLPGISPLAVKDRIPFKTIVYYLLLAFAEEAFSRGLTQYALKRRGEIYAVWMSAIFFGLIHIANLIYGFTSLFLTILAVMRAIAWGVGFGALRNRVPSIVPIMVIHFLTDIFTISIEATLKDSSWWAIAPSWFANLPEFTQWILVFEIPAYLIGLFGLYLLYKNRSEVHQTEPESPDVSESTISNSGVQSKKSRLPFVLGISLFLVIAGIGAYFVFVRSTTEAPANTTTSVNEESASKETVERVTLEFITALHSNQIAVAHEMLSENIRDSISMNDVKTLAEDHSIKSFESLDVCEIKITSSNFGEQLIGYGIIRFSDGELIFDSSLLQDSDGKWHIGGFYLEPDLTSTPSNVCEITQP